MSIHVQSIRAVAVLVCAIGTQVGMAQEANAPQEPELPAASLNAPPKAPNDCITQAATYHGVNSWLVRAIIDGESNFNERAFNRNKNGTVDVGVAQINSMHFKELSKHGIAPTDLWNGCISSYVASWHLKKQVAKFGNTWFAVGAYHSTTPCYNQRYSAIAWNTLLRWGVVRGSKLPVQSMAVCDALTGKKKSAQVSAQASSTVIAFDSP